MLRRHICGENRHLLQARNRLQAMPFHKLGLSGNFKKDGLKEIEEKTIRLVTDPIYKQNVEAFQKKCTSFGIYPANVESILNFIN